MNHQGEKIYSFSLTFLFLLFFPSISIPSNFLETKQSLNLISTSPVGKDHLTGEGGDGNKTMDSR